ncbi:HAD-IIIA family hydrolase [Paenibacillus sp. FSL R7-0331]|uniref:HAD-IIIA family hydrolase n=1 Tax=Paenibacillus sp. FSL R7-0331 TaxID=1536773 RepID=UPI0004F76E6A|nr:HAD-IIIA family hydrolase [Paenibacillus sp. FSL R7-0331]AIQ50987.1 hypothetical protein R70331_05250 [Paenibacillus sp. FSL R7-0331]
MKWSGIFIDRDGTLGGEGESVIYPGDFKLYPSAATALNLLKKTSIPLFAFTNQPGIEEGKATVQQFEQELSLWGFDYAYICPHREDSRCQCRKPQTGMLLEAGLKHRLDLKDCAVIGDRWSDIAAASAVGAFSILVMTGAGAEAQQKLTTLGLAPGLIVQDLLEAAVWISARL